MIMTGGEEMWAESGDSERIRLSREEELYKQEMIRLETDLTYELFYLSIHIYIISHIYNLKY